jgi:hypothetical protein
MFGVFCAKYYNTIIKIKNKTFSRNVFRHKYIHVQYIKNYDLIMVFPPVKIPKVKVTPMEEPGD